jgi:hypothetical protein
MILTRFPMRASPPDIHLRLYEDALLDLARAARAFAAAIDRARETGERVDDGAALELAAGVLDDCRMALLPALARAPGMLQMFATLSS